MTVSEQKIDSLGYARVQWDWASDASGDASEATTKAYTGVVVAAMFEPDSGATQPSDAYDVVVNDADGYDVLNGLGANLSNAATVLKDAYDGLLAVVEDKLTCVVANAGDTKGGKVTLVIRR